MKIKTYIINYFDGNSDLHTIPIKALSRKTAREIITSAFMVNNIVSIKKVKDIPEDLKIKMGDYYEG
jgi:hypothetical protein